MLPAVASTQGFTVHLVLNNGTQLHEVVDATGKSAAAVRLAQSKGYGKSDIRSACVGGEFLNRLDHFA